MTDKQTDRQTRPNALPCRIRGWWIYYNAVRQVMARLKWFGEEYSTC